MSRGRTKEGTVAMTPREFSRDYTDYYLEHDDDSPKKSRSHLIDRLIWEIEQKLKRQDPECSSTRKLRILDMGAGKQILERELQQNVRFRKIADRVQIVTLDIALLGKHQLLADQVEHVVADGSQLPFAAHTFDIVYSSMAIDFMPREAAFSEIQRVATSDASFHFNFHHPDLIDKKRTDTNEYTRLLRQAKRQLAQTHIHAQDSKKYEKRVTKLKQEIADLEAALSHDYEFFGQIFPELIFTTLCEVQQFLHSEFPQAYISLREYTNMGSNGWFAADVHAKVAHAFLGKEVRDAELAAD